MVLYLNQDHHRSMAMLVEYLNEHFPFVYNDSFVAAVNVQVVVIAVAECFLRYYKQE